MVPQASVEAGSLWDPLLVIHSSVADPVIFSSVISPSSESQWDCFHTESVRSLSHRLKLLSSQPSGFTSPHGGPSAPFHPSVKVWKGSVRVGAKGGDWAELSSSSW